MNFKMCKEDTKALRLLSLAEVENYEQDSFETYNTIGQIRVKKMLDETKPIVEQLYCAIEENRYHPAIKTSILDEYQGIGVFISEYPPKLMQFLNTRFSDSLGMKDVRDRWGLYMLVAINQLRNKGFEKIETPAFIIYRFRSPYKKSDADNFTVKILNDCIRDARFIPDDSFEFLSTCLMGVYDKDNFGTEIYLLPERQITEFYQILRANQRVYIL